MNGKPKREKRIEVRLSDKEYQALKDAAANREMAIAEFLRDYVKSLFRD